MKYVTAIVILLWCISNMPRESVAGPRAVAGYNLTVMSGSKIQLNGSRSSGPDGNSLSYRWHQRSGPRALIATPTMAQTSIRLPSVSTVETLVFELDVNDGELSATDHVRVIALPRMMDTHIASE